MSSLLIRDENPGAVEVSVFMPTYNQAGLLPKALDGLAAQTVRDFELIVCDDASGDGTAGILEAEFESGRPWRRLVIDRHPENRGSADAINTCAGHATGRVWTWVSSDNVMHPNWLESLLSELVEGVGAVFSAFTQIKPGGGTRGIFLRRGYSPGALISSENCFFGPSFLILSEVWRAAGGHRGRISHDYDHWTRVEEACWDRDLTVKYVPVSLCDYYCGPWQATVSRKAEYDAGKWRAVAIERRKGRDG